MSADRQLGRRVTATLAAYADNVSVDDAPFDPTRRMQDAPVDIGAGPGQPGRARSRILLAAAVLVVVGVAAALVVAHSEEDSDRAPQYVPPTTPAAPDGAMAPTWWPDEFERHRIGWNLPPSGPGMETDIPGPPGDRAQLFGDAGDPLDPGPQVLVESGGILGDPPGTALTVRGQDARELAADDVDIASASRPLGRVVWIEDNATLQATFTASQRAEALALLESLEVRPAGPFAGFEPGAGSGLDLIDEGTSPTSPQVEIESSLSYRSSPDGEQYNLQWETVGPVPDTTVDYVTARFDGETDEDGTVTVRSLSSLRVLRPDGSQAWVAVTVPTDDASEEVDEVPGLGPAGDIVERVMDSVEPVTDETLRTWYYDGAGREAAEATLLARVELHGQIIEVRGPEEARHVCAVGGDRPVCVPDPVWQSGDPMYVILPVDGGELVVAAGTGRTPALEVVREGESVAVALPAESARDGDWRVAATPMTPDMTSVGLVEPELTGFDFG